MLEGNVEFDAIEMGIEVFRSCRKDSTGDLLETNQVEGNQSRGLLEV
jgi:hypothetical protein